MYQDSRKKVEHNSNVYFKVRLFLWRLTENEKQPDSLFRINKRTGCRFQENNPSDNKIPCSIVTFELSGVSVESHKFERIAKTCVLSKDSKNVAASFDIKAGVVVYC